MADTKIRLLTNIRWEWNGVQYAYQAGEIRMVPVEVANPLVAAKLAEASTATEKREL